MKAAVRRYASVTSTMDVAAQLVRDGAAEGVVVAADEQTAGRGRQGRAWSSPPGAGLYLSVVLRPPPGCDPRVLSLLTLAAGVAVHDAVLAATGVRADLKWPNDVLVRGRKLAGILAEATGLGTPQQAVVVGVGVNLRRSAHPPEIASRATSLEEEIGRVVDRDALLDAIVAAIGTRFGQLRGGDGDGILRAWRAAAPGARGARVELADGARRGVTAGVDESGALLVETGGAVERVISGELRWL